MEEERINISKGSQKFVVDISKFSDAKQRKVLEVLDMLRQQQDAEANLEHKRGWRHMWERTPKPYLLMLGYFVFFATVGSMGFYAFMKIGDMDKIKQLYLIVFALIMLVPLLPVSYLSFKYANSKENVQDKQSESTNT